MEPTTSRTEKVDPKCDLPLQISSAGKVLPSKSEPSTLDPRPSIVELEKTSLILAALAKCFPHLA
jgi:hypothetical protein